MSSRIDSGAWRRLLPLVGEEGAGELLEALLELWCRARDARGGALYPLDSSGSPGSAPRSGAAANGTAADCAVTWGAGRFPERLPPGDAELPDGLERAELPGGVLLWSPGEAGPPEGESSESGYLTVLLGEALTNCRLRRRIKRQSFEAKYRGVELEALYDVGLAIASTLDLDLLAEEILLRAVSLLDARRGALYLLGSGGGNGDRPAEQRLVSKFGGTARESFADCGADRVPEDALPGTEHLMAAPIAVDEDRRGMLVMADKESRFGVGPFTPEDRRTLALFANQAAIALENARLHRDALEKERYARDMQLAAEIQRQILPKGVPSLPGYEIAGWNRPAREVGGDYYDLLPLASGVDEGAGGKRISRLGVALGDVSGKGVPAALMVSTLHSAIRLLMGRVETGPRLVERLNRHILASSAPNKFITLLVGELDAESGVFRYVNAGHNPGLLLRADGSVERLDPGGLPVGLLPGGSYRADRAELAPGDLLCLYSDGITECASPAEEELGEERLIELLRGVADRPVGDVLEVVEEAVTGFAEGAAQGDDQTMVLIRRRSVDRP
ncbi:MAG: SpoIIE family protein phosphatase [Acidobacteriota bacterium]|jgi:sigma-B regulation protein RsbU (phosphoserine phosphatase)